MALSIHLGLPVATLKEAIERTGVDLPLEVDKPDGEVIWPCPYRLLCARSGPATRHRTNAHNSMCTAFQTMLSMAGVPTWMERDGMWATNAQIHPDDDDRISALPESMRKKIQEIVPDIVYRNDDGQVIVADCKTQWGQTYHTTRACHQNDIQYHYENPRP